MSEKLEELHVSCVDALREYIAEANKTCKLLLDIKEFPLSIEAKLRILEQRRTENAAQAKYQKARRALFRAADWN